MNQVLPKVTTKLQFSVAHLGPFAELNQYKFAPPGLSFEIEGKVFLNPLLNLTGSEISLNKLPAKGGMPFYHKHKLNEEVYIFIKGKGQIQIDDQTVSVSEGSVVRISPGGVRCWRNNSDEPLYYIVIQAPANQYTSGDTINDGIALEHAVRWPS